MAQRHGLHVTPGVVPPRGPDGEGLLPDARQVAQQVLSVLALLIDVELHVVDAGERQHREFVALREARLDLHLPVDVVGQERQPQHFEKQLEVRLTEREDVGRAAADMPAAADTGIRCAERRLEGLLLGIAVAQPEIQHGAQRPGPVGGKRPGVEADLLDQVGIDDAHRTARRALRGKVVDVRNLDPVHEELVLRRSAAPHDQVVAVAHR